MVDFGGILGAFGGMFSSSITWIIFAVILVIGLTALLVVNKKRKFKFNGLELVNFGNGKVGIEPLKIGLVKKKSMFFNLWDYGNESVYKEAKNGRIIQEACSDDLHDINGKKGFIVRRKNDDPKILVPISKVEWNNERALFEIAPADFRDASVNIIDTATKETSGWMEKYGVYLMIGGIILFQIVSFILASQFFNGAMDKSLQVQKLSCANNQNVKAGSAP